MNTDSLLDGRYSRQVLFGGIGREGQQKLMESRVLIVGCGALGTALANTLTRGGIGFIRIADRDFVEESNLQRQQLFTTDDVTENLPKAEAARRRLNAINPYVEVEARVVDVDSTNIAELMDGIDLILDGADNFEIRYLVNDAAFRFGKPWVYAGVLGSSGMTAAFIPGETGCLRCLFPEPPAPGRSGTCDTAGVLNTIVQQVTSIQATRAIQLLCGKGGDAVRKVVTVDVWENHFSAIGFKQVDDCETCVKRNFIHLQAERGSFATSMCGRNAFQLSWKEKHSIDLNVIADNLKELGDVSVNAFLLKFKREEITLTLFPDGRAIIEGVETAPKAREFYSQYVG